MIAGPGKSNGIPPHPDPSLRVRGRGNQRLSARPAGPRGAIFYYERNLIPNSFSRIFSLLLRWFGSSSAICHHFCRAVRSDGHEVSVSYAMGVPLLDLKNQNQPLEPELSAAFLRVLRSGQFILGAEVRTFEDQIAASLGARHAIGVSSGTDAILLALMVLGIGPGDEVICPSYTFFATAGCVARVGATPVFVDSCPSCFNLNPQQIRSLITRKTRCIIPVHLFGQAAAMDAVMNVAHEHQFFVIEDAAQALGATYRGKKVGTIGHFGAFSFFPSKNLGGFGDAGMLVTNDDQLAEKARLMRAHGAKPKYYHKYLGGNFRLDPLQAALLSVKLPHCADYTARREANARYYTAAFSQMQDVDLPRPGPCGDPNHQHGAGMTLPQSHPESGHIWNQYTVRFAEGKRDSIRQRLGQRGIATEVYYPLPMHQQECFNHFHRRSLPVAARLAQEALSLPVYPELNREQLDEVIAGVREAYEKEMPIG